MTELTMRPRPEVPLQVITPADVQASIRRAKKSLESAAKEIVWQIEMEAWRTLGYTSWSAMREAEYGGAAFMVPSKSRPEIVARIRAAGLTQQEIAATAGVVSRQSTATCLRLKFQMEFQHPSPTRAASNAPPLTPGPRRTSSTPRSSMKKSTIRPGKSPLKKQRTQHPLSPSPPPHALHVMAQERLHDEPEDEDQDQRP